jgi:hypothetical protein
MSSPIVRVGGERDGEIESYIPCDSSKRQRGKSVWQGIRRCLGQDEDGSD